MGLRPPKVMENDAIVVLCLHSFSDYVTADTLKRRAADIGIELTKSMAHNMLHRATGRVMCYPDGKWRLTVQGQSYKDHVISLFRKVIAAHLTAPQIGVTTSQRNEGT